MQANGRNRGGRALASIVTAVTLLLSMSLLSSGAVSPAPAPTQSSGGRVRSFSAPLCEVGCGGMSPTFADIQLYGNHAYPAFADLQLGS